MKYDLEIENVIKAIKDAKSKRVCIQMADGLKPQAKEIVAAIKEKTDVQVVIWGGSCYGACDTPLGLEKIGVDLLIQFGHNPFIKPKI